MGQVILLGDMPQKAREMTPDDQPAGRGRPALGGVKRSVTTTTHIERLLAAYMEAHPDWSEAKCLRSLLRAGLADWVGEDPDEEVAS